MEAEVADELPLPPGWAYEPKWDGFRVVIWSPSGSRPVGGSGGDRATPRVDSRNGKPLLRYFPELEAALTRLPEGTVLDGELVVVVNGRLDFDSLQNRIHPAQSRVDLLARETPAQLALFDLLALRGDDFRPRPFSERRRALEKLAVELGVGPGDSGPGGAGPGQAGSDDADSGIPVSATPRSEAGPVRGPGVSSPWLLSPSTTDAALALRWFHDFEPAGFDGIVAKAMDRPYAEGRREMIKVKHRRTLDCVVGGYRLHKDGRRVGSLLLGLYDRTGELHFIGHCSSFSDAEAAALLEALRQLEPGTDDPSPAGFGEHARHPGAQSRWSSGKELDFVAVRPDLVIEVSYDQLTGDRFRHATRFERWRPDKDPRDCTMDQLERPKGPALVEALRRAET
jgi:ATP-dependent DNA ligase